MKYLQQNNVILNVKESKLYSFSQEQLSNHTLKAGAVIQTSMHY